MRAVMVVWVVWAVAACASTPSSGLPTPAPRIDWSERSFAAEVERELVRRFPGANITPSGDVAFRVTGTEAKLALEVSFAKAREACRADWGACGGAVDHTLRAMSEARAHKPIAPAQLRLVLRTNAKVDRVKTVVPDTVARPFSHDTQWLLAADLPTTTQLGVRPDATGMTADQAWAVAAANMKRPAAQLVTATAGPFIMYQDDYAPSALLAPDVLLESANAHVPGRIGSLLALCPEENMLVYTIGGPAEITRLRELASDISAQATMPLSRVIMEWTGLAWREVP